jgi:integrase
MIERLMVRCSGKQEGWLFPSSRALSGHLATVAKQFREARSKAGLPKSLVLYCGRHTFGTAAYEATDVRTSMRYQHPVLDSVREAIDQRNLRHNSRHNELRVQ